MQVDTRYETKEKVYFYFEGQLHPCIICCVNATQSSTLETVVIEYTVKLINKKAWEKNSVVENVPEKELMSDVNAIDFIRKNTQKLLDELGVRYSLFSLY